MGSAVSLLGWSMFMVVGAIGVQVTNQPASPVVTGPVQGTQAAPLAGEKPAEVATAIGSVVLKNSLSSKSSHEGAEIKATLRKNVTLPGGEVLPKGTLLIGHVVQVSAHSKEKPNGAMLLNLDSAQSKGGTPIPLKVVIQSLAPDAGSANETTALPGARVGGSSNAGGSEQLGFENNDRTTPLRSNIKQSGLDGVYLKSSPGGSGVVFAAGADVYLDAGIQMTISLVPAAAMSH